MAEATLMRPALTARQLERMAWRIERFQRFGLSADEAERTADALADRDHDRDDRRMCLECSNLGRDHTCAAARRGLSRHSLNNAVQIVNLLMRCEQFNFATPA